MYNLQISVSKEKSKPKSIDNVLPTFRLLETYS